MFGHTKTDILILGAGPVGLAAAHALASEEVDFTLLEREPRAGSHSYALALHPETLELLERFGLVGEVLERAIKLDGIALYEGNKRKAELDYRKLSSPYAFLAVLPQNELEAILIGALERRGHHLHWNHRARSIQQDNSGVTLSVDQLQEAMTGYAVARIEREVDKVVDMRSRYLIGADGHNSLVRRFSGIDFPVVAPTTEFAVFEFKTDAVLSREMRLMCGEDETHICWPLPGGYCRWSFQLPRSAVTGLRRKDHELVQDSTGEPLLDEKQLHKWLSAHAPWFTGSVGHIRWRMLVRFEQRLVPTFGREQVWLAGDSAHVAPPGGVLSMNVGMQEAARLARQMSLAMGNTSAHGVLLDAYNEQCQQQWRALLNLDAALQTGSQTDPWVAQCLRNLIGNIPASGSSLSQLLSQLGIS